MTAGSFSLIVATFIYDHAGRFPMLNVDSGIDDYEAIPLTVNTLEDLVQANWLAFRLVYHHNDHSLDTVVNLAREWRRMRRHKGRRSA